MPRWVGNSLPRNASGCSWRLPPSYQRRQERNQAWRNAIHVNVTPKHENSPTAPIRKLQWHSWVEAIHYNTNVRATLQIKLRFGHRRPQRVLAYTRASRLSSVGQVWVTCCKSLRPSSAPPTALSTNAALHTCLLCFISV